MKKNYTKPAMRLRPGLLNTFMQSSSQSPWAGGKGRNNYTPSDDEGSQAGTGAGITKSLW